MSVSNTSIHLDSGSLAEQLARDVREGLTATPKTLPPKYFYDARGSELFDEITRLPEYYPTRTEARILMRHAGDIAEATKARTLIELGSGTSEKTRILLRALTEAGTLEQFVPFDVDPAVLKLASAAIGDEFPGLEVAPVVGDFDHHLGELPAGEQRVVAFLGSTIGNFGPEQRAGFLHDVRQILGVGDSFLLGLDLVKDEERLVQAYDDAQGVTAAFNRNVLAVVNRELGADFDLDAFAHVALWDPEQEWIEMRLRSLTDQTVRIPRLDLDVAFAEGEEMRTEISAKFRREGIAAELEAAGLQLTHWWTDPDGDFGLLLAEPA